MKASELKELTPEQIEKLGEYRDKWIAKGLCTDRVTLERTVEIIHDTQTILLGRVATPVILVDSPILAWEAVRGIALAEGALEELEAADWERHFGPDYEKDKVLLTRKVHAAILRDMNARVNGQLGAEDDVDITTPGVAELVAEISAEVQDCVNDPVAMRDMPFQQPWLTGSFDANSLSTVDVYTSLIDVCEDDELRRKTQAWIATAELNYIYPLERFCVVSQKPSEIHKNEHGMHRDGGKAIAYGEWGFYVLNGVVVPEYLAMTPSEELDINWFLKEQNADVKAEFVRKYGVERLLHLGKQVDSYKNYPDEEWWTKSEYELWDMAAIFPGLTYQPYLKMLNQTTGIWHVEACSPECLKLPGALKERFGGDFEVVSIS